MQREREKPSAALRLLPTAAGVAVRAQDLGPYPSPAPSCTVISSVDGGYARGEAKAAGGRAPADPAAQEEIFVDASGASAVWRSLGGQIAHKSFRSVVLGPNAALEGGLRGGGGGGSSSDHGAIIQAVRCRFPTLLEGWSSIKDGRGEGGEKKLLQRRVRRRSRGPWSVCILRNPDLVTVHLPSGEYYDVTLPCEARLLQPLGEGLLVQRISGTDDENDREEDSEGSQGSPYAVPSLFSLSHPLDELRPVALLPPSVVTSVADGNRRNKSASACAASPAFTSLFAGEDQQHQQRLVCDSSEGVIFARGGGDGGTGADISLLLTYHAGHRRHSLWQVQPAPEPEEESEEQENESKSGVFPPPATGVAGGDVSVLGPLMDQSPVVGVDSWRPTTGLSSTLAADASSLGSVLLGVSALDSSSSAAGLSITDTGLTAGHPRRERLSAGGGGVRRSSAGRSRLSNGGGSGGGAGRRTSTGSNSSWIGAGTTRKEALASALGLGQSGLGVASNVLSLSATGGQGGAGERGRGAEPFLPTLMGRDIAGESSIAFGSEAQTPEGEEGGIGGPEPIRPHLGVALVWREEEESLAPVQHVFCAAAGVSSSAKAEGIGHAESGSFLVCLVEGHARRMRALSVSYTTVAGEEDDRTRVEVAEAFTVPCSSAIGLCAMAGGEGEGTPGGMIAADILILALDGTLVLYRGETPVTRVALPAAAAAAPSTVVGGCGGSSEAMPDESGGDVPESISDAVGSCFTLTVCGGSRRRLRVSLDPVSPLVAACLGAWDCLVSSSLSASLRADVVCAAHYMAGQQTERPDAFGNIGDCGGVEDRSYFVEGRDLDWAALVAVLQKLIFGDVESLPSEGKKRQEHIASKERKRGGGGVSAEDAAWNSLLSSPFHGQFSRDNAMLLSGFGRNGNGGSGGGLQKSRGAGGAKGRRTKGNAITEALPPPVPAPQQRILRTQREAFIAEVGAVFDGLHLVLEDLKTSRLTVALVPRLASLLLSLTRACGDNGGADMREFADYYWRDAAGCGGYGDGERASMIDRGEGRGLLGKRSGGGFLPSRPTRFWKVKVLLHRTLV